MNRAEDLRTDYDRLGELLANAEGSAAAAIARERRIIGELLESLELPKVVPKVVELATRQQSRTRADGAAARRRKSG